jgi:hypothetical protein
MMFNSRGLKDAAAKKGSELEAALMEASEGGKIPIVCDTSPCLSQIKAGISEPALRFALYEPVEFIRHFLVDKLEFTKVRPGWGGLPSRPAGSELQRSAAPAPRQAASCPCLSTRLNTRPPHPTPPHPTPPPPPTP